MHFDPNSRTAAGFLVAPIIPVALYSASAGAYFWLILIIGMPAAYLGALLVGVPMFLVLRSLKCLSWHYFVLGGLLTSVPFVFFYMGSAETHLEIYGARNTVFLSAFGSVGGFIFWFIAIRGQARSYISAPRKTIGLILLASVLSLAIYILLAGKTSDEEGSMLVQDIEFISDIRRKTEIKLNGGGTVSAYLPSQLPYRPLCPIYVTYRRAYFTSGTLYWVTGYSDSPIVNIWSILEQSKRDEIPKECS